MQVFNSSFGSVFLQITHVLSCGWGIFTLLFDVWIRTAKENVGQPERVVNAKLSQVLLQEKLSSGYNVDLRALRFAERKINEGEEMQA